MRPILRLSVPVVLRSTTLVLCAGLAVALGCSVGCGGSQTGDAASPDASATPDSGASSGSGAEASASTGSGSSEPAPAAGGKAEVGSAAPEISAAFVTGVGPKTLADAKGKVVILDFWGTYCGPCKASFPKYQALLDQFGKDLAIIAVSEDDPDDAKESDLKDFAKKTGVKFSILWDKKKETAKIYSPPNMPTSFIIGKDGKIVSMHAKYESGDEKKIESEVKALMK